jgi:hypothetical protein
MSTSLNLMGILITNFILQWVHMIVHMANCPFHKLQVALMVYIYGHLCGMGFPSASSIMAFIIGGSSDFWCGRLEVEKCKVDEGWIERRPMLVVSPLPAKYCLVNSSINYLFCFISKIAKFINWILRL